VLHYTPPSVWIILGPVLVIGALGLLLPLLAKTGQRAPEEGWKGMFYSNPENPALLVPKRYGVGYTLNFGNPWAWVVMLFILVMIAIPIVFAAISASPLTKHK